MRVSIGDLTLNVVDSGAGDVALLFLHYWGGSATTWQQVILALQNSYRCVAYDQRGWGASDAPSAGYGLRELADDALALVHTLGLKRFVLVGHSMGGKVVQMAASKRPLGLEAIVLVAPASPFPQQLSEPARLAQFHAYDSRQTVLDAVNFLTRQQLDDTALEQVIQDSLGGSLAATRAWPLSTAYENVSEVVPKIAVPALVVVGDSDPQDPVEQQNRDLLPLLSTKALQVIPDSGHLLPLERPQELAHAIRSYLDTTLKYAQSGVQ